VAGTGRLAVHTLEQAQHFRFGSRVRSRLRHLLVSIQLRYVYRKTDAAEREDSEGNGD
jgi:hypothetical protein